MVGGSFLMPVFRMNWRSFSLLRRDASRMVDGRLGVGHSVGPLSQCIFCGGNWVKGQSRSGNVQRCVQASIHIAHAKATMYVGHHSRGTDTIIYTKNFLIQDWQQLIGESGICQIIQFLHFNLLKCAWCITVIFWNDTRGMLNFLCASHIFDVVNQWKNMESRHFPSPHVPLVPTVGCALRILPIYFGIIALAWRRSMVTRFIPFVWGVGFLMKIDKLSDLLASNFPEISIGDCLWCFF